MVNQVEAGDPAEKLILLLGAGGQVGRALQQTLAPLGSVLPVIREQCDLSDPEAVKKILERTSPDIIVNAAAYTAVDKAESEPELARCINAELLSVLADWSSTNHALLVDFSTDYIFDGNKQEPWRESDRRNPLNSYGETKRAGLEAIERSGCRYLVFIVTWVYDRQGKNFPNTIKRLAAEKEAITVVADQRGAPTPARWIGETVAECIRQAIVDPDKCGLYNLAPSGSASWFEFAREVVSLERQHNSALALTLENIRPVSSAEYPTPARRPANSVLDTTKLQQTFVILPPHWRELFEREWSLDL